jgi:prepilin-type N-terminal cleavage/methylation domain-containing protein
MRTVRPRRLMRWGGSFSHRHRGFTLIELMVTLSVIMLLAALTVGGLSRATAKGRQARVQAELGQLVTAIESYKASMGTYPPDNPVNPARNSLRYELTGVVVDNERGEFRTPGGGQVLRPQLVRDRFNVEGFANAVTDPGQVRRFLDPKSEQVATLSRQVDDVEVLVVPVAWPLRAAQQPIPENPGLNPWRYLGPGNATNNVDSFDLWAEFVDGKHVRVMGNWRADAFVDRPFERQ